LHSFAIPVVTKYVADFLGFGHLIRSANRPKAPYSENEIYRHISNCQVFLSYNSDETKMLARRKAFKQSMAFLHKLVLGGNIAKANRYSATKYFFGTRNDNAMAKLGYEIAERLLLHVPNAEAAAAIMVFVGLHAAYNSVLAVSSPGFSTIVRTLTLTFWKFTSVLNWFLEETYEYANPHKNPDKPRKGEPKWFRVQKLAFMEDEKSTQELQRLVLEAERRSIKLPIIRKAVASAFGVKADQIVILDVVSTAG
jgi:nitroreductase